MNTWTFGWICAWLVSSLLHIFWLNDVIRGGAFAFGACRITCEDKALEVTDGICYCIDAVGVKTPREIPKYPE
jgi:hypothetical protein